MSAQKWGLVLLVAAAVAYLWWESQQGVSTTNGGTVSTSGGTLTFGLPVITGRG